MNDFPDFYADKNSFGRLGDAIVRTIFDLTHNTEDDARNEAKRLFDNLPTVKQRYWWAVQHCYDLRATSTQREVMDGAFLFATDRMPNEPYWRVRFLCAAALWIRVGPDRVDEPIANVLKFSYGDGDAGQPALFPVPPWAAGHAHENRGHGVR